MTLIYPYPPLKSGILIKRYKRFLADIELESGEIITAHCANTGPMIGLHDPGSFVQVSRSNNPKRKLPYTWEMICVNAETQPTWVGVNTAIPNRVIKLALEQKLLPELAQHYDTIRSEVPCGREKKSRIDFFLSDRATSTGYFLEVKSATWSQGNIALFPDTVTTRGQKHLRELMGVLGTTKAGILYFINRGDCDRFAPGDRRDRVYGELLREAIASGVEVFPYRFEITPQGIYFRGLAEFVSYQPADSDPKSVI
ncbi:MULTISPECIES: DNA/RNA nuclease SfsA [Spirulina sp. CCY15215]|uniref:DNA/RNA nuclease SfsA n=1 Tax=Spirulina sp. CCY15215 TaxID=2767591 RepID=UPI00194F888D|nr:DNA/RNA nuclease SfsA [Spirulina major]